MYVDVADSEKYFLKQGDIVFARTGASVGKSYLYCQCDGELVYAGFLIKVHPDSITFYPPYVFYFVHTAQYWNWVAKTSMRSGQPGINGAEYGGLLLPCPHIAEQKAISSALSDVDALLSSLDALIAKKRDIKTAAMQELLTGRRRLPGFSGEWVEKTLSTVAMIVGGGTPSTAESSYWNGSIPWFTPAEISTAGKYISHSERNISEEGLKKSSAKLLPVGTILLTTRASIGLRAILTVPATTNQGFQSLIVNSDTDSEFIYYLLENIQQELVKQASGSTFLEISPRKLGEIPLRLPSSSTEQAAIAAVLSDMDAEITALEARRAKVQALKQGMMQELLTGKTRLAPTGDQHG